MRQDDELRETLYCIRCGACANSCANFQSAGGHAFGGETYTGGIATGWEAGIEGLDIAEEFNDLCTGCSRFVNACPVKIDIPWINTVVRDRINHGKDPGFDDLLVDGLVPDEEENGTPLRKRFFGNFETVAKIGSATAPLSNAVASTGMTRKAMEAILGVDARRDLPAFERTTLREWASSRDSRIEDPVRRVALYPDVYTSYVQTERGEAAVRVLEALDCEVVVPDVGGSGRAPLLQGMLATTQRKAANVTESLLPYLDTGYDVVVVEPSDLAMFRREYEKLLLAEKHERIDEGSYEILESSTGFWRTAGPPTLCPLVTAPGSRTTATANSERSNSNRTRRRSWSDSDTTCLPPTWSVVGWPGVSATRASTTTSASTSAKRSPNSSKRPRTSERSSPAGRPAWSNSTRSCRRGRGIRSNSSIPPASRRSLSVTNPLRES